MTATRRPTHWAIRALRHLNEELLGAGEAMARSARAPQPGPQPDPAEAPHTHPASAGKVLPRV